MVTARFVVGCAGYPKCFANDDAAKRCRALAKGRQSRGAEAYGRFFLGLLTDQESGAIL